MEQAQGPNKALIAIIVVVLLAAVGGGAFYLSQKNEGTNPVGTTAAEEETVPSESQPDAADEYNDGTYAATGTYQSPGGEEEIEVSVTLKGGVITSTSAQTQAASGTSRQYQQEFVSGYKQRIIGKNINDVELDRVAGSSLTSNGFNDALEKIKQDAAA